MNIKQLILDGTQYGGNVEKGVKALSASQMNDDILRLWLRYKHGVIPSTDVSMATIGSLGHIAVEKLIENQPSDSVKSEVPMKVTMSNGWNLTGTADIVDHNEMVIYDLKFIKKYRVTVLKKLAIDDDYIMQLNIYRYLMKKIMGEDYTMKVVALSPDGGFNFKTAVTDPVYQEIEIPNYFSDEDIEDIFNEKVSNLLFHIENDTIPEICDDVWNRKVAGKTLPIRCLKYCDYVDVCPRHAKMYSQPVIPKFNLEENY